jgi:putative transposase
MTVDPNSIDLPAFMAEHLQRAEPDLLRSMLSTFVQALMFGRGRRDLRCPVGRTQPGADQLPQRLPDPGVRLPHRHDGGRDPQAA